MAFVIGRLAFAGGAEWLAGAATGPNRSRVVPAGEAEGVGPSPNAREPVALGVAAHVVGSDIDDAALVNIAWCDESRTDEFAEPGGRKPVVLVVVGAAIHVVSPIPVPLRE